MTLIQWRLTKKVVENFGWIIEFIIKNGIFIFKNNNYNIQDNSPLRDESPTSIKELAGKEVLIRDETSLDQSKAYYFVNDMPVVVGLNGIKHE